MQERNPSVHLPIRPRRLRQSPAIRSLVQQTRLSYQDLVYPVFVVEGEKRREPIASMPGIFRYSLDTLLLHLQEVVSLGIEAIALFPAISDAKKDRFATESTNPDGLLPSTIRSIKGQFPQLCIISDVAMDPYSSDGHDGLVENGQILNDATLPILAAMAVTQAQAGASIVAPSDMMDGRVAYIRAALDKNGFQEVSILAYSAKYASAFYGPFRDALDSAPKSGDKKTYQMDPANATEALRECDLDIQQGADMVMVKPAGAYLDIITRVKQHCTVPVAAYQVSGEYAMLHFAAQAGALDLQASMLESLVGIKRAGADIILSYFDYVTSILLSQMLFFSIFFFRRFCTP